MYKKAMSFYESGRYLKAVQVFELLLDHYPEHSLSHKARYQLGNIYFYKLNQPEQALTCARQSIEDSPRELWIVRILARLFMAVSLQMMGDTSRAYTAIYRGFEEEKTHSVRFKATLVMTVCHLHWITTNLHSMAQTATESIKLSQDADMPEILNFSYFHLGQVCYQQNDLTAVIV